jgi:nitrogen regulatory protein P-II 1
VVCRRDDVDRLLRTVVETAGSGCRGDGIVFVTPVERAVKIRNAAEGAVALHS